MEFIVKKQNKQEPRKRIYLFVFDDNRRGRNQLRDYREEQVILLKPNFIATGGLRHCAKENILFWLKERVLNLGHLMAIWFFFDPDSIKNIKPSLLDLSKYYDKTINNTEKQ